LESETEQQLIAAVYPPWLLSDLPSGIATRDFHALVNGKFLNVVFCSLPPQRVYLFVTTFLLQGQHVGAIYRN
jgi:hypothetical protein